MACGMGRRIVAGSMRPNQGSERSPRRSSDIPPASHALVRADLQPAPAVQAADDRGGNCGPPQAGRQIALPIHRTFLSTLIDIPREVPNSE